MPCHVANPFLTLHEIPRHNWHVHHVLQLLGMQLPCWSRKPKTGGPVWNQHSDRRAINCPNQALLATLAMFVAISCSKTLYELSQRQQEKGGETGEMKMEVEMWRLLRLKDIPKEPQSEPHPQSNLKSALLCNPLFHSSPLHSSFPFPSPFPQLFSSRPCVCIVVFSFVGCTKLLYYFSVALFECHLSAHNIFLSRTWRLSGRRQTSWGSLWLCARVYSYSYLYLSDAWTACCIINVTVAEAWGQNRHYSNHTRSICICIVSICICICICICNCVVCRCLSCCCCCCVVLLLNKKRCGIFMLLFVLMFCCRIYGLMKW